MSETPEQYSNEPESVGIEKSLVGLQQSVERLAASVRRVHGIEAPSTGEQPMSAEERLDVLKDIRWDLHQVAEKLQNPMAALDALKVAQAKLQVLIKDASKPE